MTLLEKAMEKNKKQGYVNSESDIINNCCPHDFGLEDKSCTALSKENCFNCWNREMPNTEPKSNGIPVIPQSEVNASQNGYRQGRIEGYNEGLNDVWELSKKLFDMGLKLRMEIFGTTEILRIMGYTPQEALAKLKAYEEAQSKIEVGDVVETTDLVNVFNGVVLDFKDSTDDEVVVFTENGCVDVWNIKEVKKTGKHIDVQNILEQIK